MATSNASVNKFMGIGYIVGPAGNALGEKDGPRGPTCPTAHPVPLWRRQLPGSTGDVPESLSGGQVTHPVGPPLNMFLSSSGFQKKSFHIQESMN